MDKAERTETSKKTYESIVERIKSDILKGTLKPGDRLPPERELARRYCASRTSIREALKTLEILGVTESIQGSGNYITGNHHKSLTESMSMMFLLQKIDSLQISQLREALETKAALLAVENITDSQIEHMEGLVAQMALNVNEEHNVALDKELHYTLAQASGNPIIIQVLDALSELINIYIKDRRKEILSDSQNVTRLQSIHEDIVKGLRKRDSQATYKAVNEHFSLISEYIKGNPSILG